MPDRQELELLPCCGSPPDRQRTRAIHHRMAQRHHCQGPRTTEREFIMTIVSATTSRGTSSRGTSSQVRSSIIAGLVIAIVNGLDQTLFAVVTQHVTPVTVFQYFASALLGLAAFGGGYTTALLGLLIHLVIAFVVAGVFILAASRSAFLRHTVFLSALIYGAGVNVISGLVLPFTAAPKLSVTAPAVVHGLIADALFIGLPLALTVWLGARTRKERVPA